MYIHDFRTLTGNKSLCRLSVWVCTLLVISFSLSSCQTITRFKCNHKNWTDVGKEDGAAGKVAEDTFLQYHNECSASGADIDESTYLAGYQEGLAAFCTLEGGMAQALDGNENQKLCAAQFGPAFDDGFAQGLAKLCDSSGGQQFGLNGGIYKGTCPSETEQLFLTSYLNAISITLPQSIAEVTILEGRSNSLQSDISSLEIQVSTYDSAIESAKKSKNTTWEKQLKNNRSMISSRLSQLRMDQSRTDGDLSGAREKADTLRDMLLKWQLQLDV